jgi:hypothetical protein
MTLIEQHIGMYKGNTQNLAVTVKNSDGSIKDLSSASATFVLYNDATKVVYVTKLTPSDIVITNPTGGILVVKMVPADTSTLKAGPWYHYEVEVKDAGNNESTVISGNFTLWESVI